MQDNMVLQKISVNILYQMNIKIFIMKIRSSMLLITINLLYLLMKKYYYYFKQWINIKSDIKEKNIIDYITVIVFYLDCYILVD